MFNKKFLISFILFFLLTSTFLFSVNPDFDDKQVYPYEPNEFSLGLQNLRRFEQIFIGSFPLAIFFSQMLGGLGLIIQDTYYQSQIEEGRSAIERVKFGVENYGMDDKIRILSAGIGISLGIAIADMIIYQSKEKKEKNKYKRKRLLQSLEENDGKDQIGSEVLPGTN